MSDFNQVIMTGRLTRDPEIRYSPGGVAITNIGLACDQSYVKDGNRVENTVFVDATAFAGGAEFIGRHGFKGQRVGISGQLNLESWEDKNTGQRRTKISIKVREFNPIDWKPREENQQQNPPQVGNNPPPTSNPADDDDVPF